MAVLKGADGKFYEVPEDQLGGFEIPADEVKAKLEECGAPGPGGRGGVRPMGSPQVLVQVYGGGGGRGRPITASTEEGGDVSAYGHHWCGHHCGRHCGHHCGHNCGRHCGHWCW